jgi:hypothetical protein
VLAKLSRLYTAVFPSGPKFATVWEVPSSTSVLDVVNVA